jgi:hypothetical protein
MRVIVKIKPSGKSLYRLLRHVYLDKGPAGREVPSILTNGSRVTETISAVPGVIQMNASLDAKVLAGDVEGRSQYRHVVISAADTEDLGEREKNIKGLVQMGKEWMKTFAPGTPYIGVAHDDRRHTHLHLVLKNEGLDGRCLSWAKDTVRTMQSMEWVSLETMEIFDVQSGRGKGINNSDFSNSPYPLANLHAKTLAGMTTEKINELTSNGTITTGRINKRGEITSINYNGRRIRLRTIAGLAHTGQNQVSKTASRRSELERKQTLHNSGYRPRPGHRISLKR